MIYLLDTNVVIALMKLRSSVVAKLKEISATDCAISTITGHELFYGAFRRQPADGYLKRLNVLPFESLDFNLLDAQQASEIRAKLAGLGTPIGPYDTLIAGQAVSRDLILVTHNAREFSRVPGLKLEDWET